MNEMPTVVIAIEGGIVTSITATTKMNVAIIDYDTEGADDDDVTTVPQEDGVESKAYATMRHSDVDPDRALALGQIAADHRDDRDPRDEHLEPDL